MWKFCIRYDGRFMKIQNLQSELKSDQQEPSSRLKRAEGLLLHTILQIVFRLDARDAVTYCRRACALSPMNDLISFTLWDKSCGGKFELWPNEVSK